MENTLVMKSREKRWIGAAFALLLLGGAVATAAATPETEKAPATKSEAAANQEALVKVDTASFPKSTFRIPENPIEGRNPFFPNSVANVPVAAPVIAPSFDVSALVLNGITGPPLRSAMINGQTFLEGEEAEVKLESGARILIKCEKLYNDRAVILVAGSRKELKLRIGL